MVQDGYIHRRGFRGRWLTVYLHKFTGLTERVERMHSHPWLWAFAIKLSGTVVDDRPGRHAVDRRVAIYHATDRHRIKRADGWTIFIGLLRTQIYLPQTAETPCPEGYAHYTEIAPGEPGHRPDNVWAPRP